MQDIGERKNIMCAEPYFGHEGILKAYREYLKQLHKQKHKLWIRDFYDPQFGDIWKEMYNAFDLTKVKDYVFLKTAYMDQWIPIARKHPNFVGISVLEGDKIPQQWVMNGKHQSVKQIWLPSKHCIDTYTACGIPENKIKYIPHIYDTNFMPGQGTFFQKNGDITLRNSFKFFGMGAIYGLSQRDRKGIDVLLNAFVENFYEVKNTALVVKLNLMYAEGSYKNMGMKFKLSEYVESLIPNKYQDILATGRIQFITEALTDVQLSNLYNSVDCMVHCTRAEGFGLSAFEGIGCNLPVICTNYGGTNDFSDKRLRIDVKEMKLAEFDDVSLQRYPYIGSKWAEPSIDSCGKKMLQVYENYKKEKELALEHGKLIREQFSAEKVGKLMDKALAEL